MLLDHDCTASRCVYATDLAWHSFTNDAEGIDRLLRLPAYLGAIYCNIYFACKNQIYKILGGVRDMCV